MHFITPFSNFKNTQFKVNFLKENLILINIRSLFSTHVTIITLNNFYKAVIVKIVYCIIHLTKLQIHLVNLDFYNSFVPATIFLLFLIFHSFTRFPPFYLLIISIKFFILT